MRDRVKSLKRILNVQKHLHNIEELKYVRAKQNIDRCRDEQRAMADALSDDGALHGLFTDMTVRRLKSLRQEEARLVPKLEEQARVLLEHGGRLRNSERLAREIGIEHAREEERRELERLLESGLAQSRASPKQDR